MRKYRKKIMVTVSAIVISLAMTIPTFAKEATYKTPSEISYGNLKGEIDEYVEDYIGTTAGAND